MNKKGFSLVELLAVIVILGIIASIAIVSYNALINQTETKSYKNYESSMKSSATMYILDNGYKDKITLAELINSDKIDEFNNPNSDDKCLDSYVSVIKNNNDSFDLSYKVCLICPEYKSEGC